MLSNNIKFGCQTVNFGQTQEGNRNSSNPQSSKLGNLLNQIKSADSFESAKIAGQIKDEINREKISNPVQKKVIELLDQLKSSNPFDSAKIAVKIKKILGKEDNNKV